MEVHSSRFGTLEVDDHDVVHFPAGLLGLAGARDWVLLADAHDSALGWLQCVGQSDVALAVVSPRRFVPDYQVRINRRELAPLGLDDVRQAKVLVIVGKNERSITLNLKAPLVLNLERRMGCQLVVNDEQPIQYELQAPPAPLRKSA
jgi:flagellar assembly factor FliW